MSRLMKLSVLATMFMLGGIFCGPLAASGPELVLSDEGRSDYTIVIASGASPSEKHGAEELQMFLAEISGARLPIVTDREAVNGPMVLVGQSGKVDALETGIDFASLGKEGFVIRTVSPHLVLAGGRQRGSMYAVYTFLEDHLGCRWFTPTASRIPKRERIEIGSISVRQDPPALGVRSIVIESMDPDWAVRNKINAGFQSITTGVTTGKGYLDLEQARGGGVVWKGSHTFHHFLPPKEYFHKHPEYYAMTDGERRKTQLCLTNPEVVQIVAKNVKKCFGGSPGADIVAIGQEDGFSGWCECPECAALDEKEGSRSATVINFANQVADIVGEEFPDVAIGTWGYIYTKKPPKTIRPRPNVVVMLPPIQNCLSHPVVTDDVDHVVNFRDHIAEWSKLTEQLFVWDYINCFHHFLLPFPNLDALQPNVKFYVDNGARGLFYQGDPAGPGDMNELRHYVLAKCLWNPDTDAHKARDEFLEGYYGPAAPPIREYLEMLHKKVREENIHIYIWSQPTEAYLTPEILSRAGELFDEAERRVEKQPELLNHVRVARLSLQYVKLSRGAGLTSEDCVVVLEKFKAVVEREKILEYGENKYMTEWLTEKKALYGRLPENVVYDLCQNLGRAKARNCRMLETRSIQKNGQTLMVILEHPPDEGVGDATYEIPLPASENGEKLVLRFGTCFSEPTANGVRFAVLVDGKEVWSGEQKDLAPVDHQLDLSGSAGKTISLTLRVDAMGNGAYDWSCWVRPQIQTRVSE